MSTIPLWISIIMIYHLWYCPLWHPTGQWLIELESGIMCIISSVPPEDHRFFIRYLWAGGNISGHYSDVTWVSPLEYLFNSSFGLTSHKHQYPHNGPFLKGTHWNAEKFSILSPHRQCKIDICFSVELVEFSRNYGSSFFVIASMYTKCRISW